MEKAFETDNVTVAVVCPDSSRVGQLIDWTMRELTARRTRQYADLFLFTSASPVVSAERFFWIGFGIRPTLAKPFRSWISPRDT